MADVTEIGDNRRMSTLRPTRRTVITGLATALAAPALIGRASAGDFVNPYDFGFNPDIQGDQTEAIQAAINEAANFGKDLLFPPGEYFVSNLQFYGSTRYIGSSGGTQISTWEKGPIGTAGTGLGMVFDGISFSAPNEEPILVLEESENVTFRDCIFNSGGIAIDARSASATIENCRFDYQRDASIHSVNSRGGLFIRGCRFSEIGNAAIRVWRDEAGHDGSIISGNSITKVDWTGGGNGQNGNGVNVFQADGVIVADNVISDCAFTAVRVNAGRNTQVRGNTCLRSGEVAIFSEFGFSGSVIADNIIDGAATGIDITNLDSGGYLATCTGNIVRNISPSSAVNPDTRPVGIYAEADTVVANNVIENVPGIGIAAGYGPFVRNVSVTGNVLTACTMGIGVTVVNDPKVGRVTVTGNTISGATRGGVVGLEWENVVSDDLARDAGKYAHILVTDNAVA